MFVLTGWRKNGDKHVIAVCEEREPLKQLAIDLDKEAHYTPGEGMWDKQVTAGCFYVEEVIVVSKSGEDSAVAFQKGVDFINYKDRPYG